MVGADEYTDLSSKTLKVGLLNTDVTFTNINVHFDNLVGGGDFGEVINMVISSLGNKIWDMVSGTTIYSSSILLLLVLSFLPESHQWLNLTVYYFLMGHPLPLFHVFKQVTKLQLKASAAFELGLSEWMVSATTVQNDITKLSQHYPKMFPFSRSTRLDILLHVKPPQV